eukprot:7919120-Pyramimonas_sp.AAC.1
MGRARAETVSRHSRALTHVLGPGLHRIISQADWAFMYQHRLVLRAGPAVQLLRACRHLDIDWVSATSLACNGRAFRFSLRPDLLAQAHRSTARTLSRAAK